MNELRMQRLFMDAETLAIDVKRLVRLSRDDKRLESLLLTAREALGLARERAAENLKRGEIADV